MIARGCNEPSSEMSQLCLIVKKCVSECKMYRRSSVFSTYLRYLLSQLEGGLARAGPQILKGFVISRPKTMELINAELMRRNRGDLAALKPGDVLDIRITPSRFAPYQPRDPCFHCYISIRNTLRTSSGSV